MSIKRFASFLIIAGALWISAGVVGAQTYNVPSNGGFDGSLQAWTIPYNGVGATFWDGTNGHDQLGSLKLNDGGNIISSPFKLAGGAPVTFYFKQTVGSLRNITVYVFDYDGASYTSTNFAANGSGNWQSATLNFNSAWVGHVIALDFVFSNACSPSCPNAWVDDVQALGVAPYFPYGYNTPIPIDWSKMPTPNPYPTQYPYPTQVPHPTQLPYNPYPTQLPYPTINISIPAYPTQLPYPTQRPYDTPVATSVPVTTGLPVNGSFVGSAAGWTGDCPYSSANGHSQNGELNGSMGGCYSTPFAVVGVTSTLSVWVLGNSYRNTAYIDFDSTSLGTCVGNSSTWTECQFSLAGFVGSSGSIRLQNGVEMDDVSVVMLDGSGRDITSSGVGSTITNWSGMLSPLQTAVARVSFGGTAQPVYLATPMATQLPYLTQIPYPTVKVDSNGNAIVVNATPVLTPSGPRSDLVTWSAGGQVDYSNLNSGGTVPNWGSGSGSNPLDLKVIKNDYNVCIPSELSRLIAVTVPCAAFSTYEVGSFHLGSFDLGPYLLAFSAVFLFVVIARQVMSKG